MKSRTLYNILPFVLSGVPRETLRAAWWIQIASYLIPTLPSLIQKSVIRAMTVIDSLDAKQAYVFSKAVEAVIGTAGRGRSTRAPEAP
jgi:hypothetical protein